MSGSVGRRRWLQPLAVVALLLLSPPALADRAPIRVFGHLGYEYRFDRFDDGAERMEHSQILSFGGASYLWQPWFAQTSGTLNFRLRESEQDGGSRGGLGAAPGFGDRTGTFLSGLATLRLFPVSRFPFEVYYERRRDEIDDAFFDTDTRLTRYGLVQRYTSGSGTRYSARYEHRVRTFEQTTSNRDETDTSDVFQIDVGRRFGNVSVDFNSTYGAFEEASSGDETSTWFSTMRHRYSADRNLSIDGQIAFRRLDFDEAAGDRTLRRFEWSEFALWRPRSETPLWFVGAVRLVDSDSDFGELELDRSSISTTLGARYELTSDWELAADLTTRTTSRGGGDTRTDSLQRAIARYRAPTFVSGPLSYDWYGSAEVGHERTEETERRDFGYVGLRLGHELGRAFAARTNSPLRLRLRQEASANEDSDGRSIQTLEHDAILSWSRSSAVASTFAGLTISDSRTFGGGERFGDESGEFQIVNFQLSRYRQLAREATFSGSVNAQAHRTSGFVEGAADDGEFEPSASVDLSYDQRRLFGVTRLHFRSALRYFTSTYHTLLDSTDVAEGTIGTIEHAGTVWDNRLQYTIGRLGLLAIVRLSEIRERDHALVFLQVRRHFDSFY